MYTTIQIIVLYEFHKIDGIPESLVHRNFFMGKNIPIVNNEFLYIYIYLGKLE